MVWYRFFSEPSVLSQEWTDCRKERRLPRCLPRTTIFSRGPRLILTIPLDDHEARLQEAEEAFAALQVLDRDEDDGDAGSRNDEGDSSDKDEFLTSLESIDPLPYMGITSIGDDIEPTLLLPGQIKEEDDNLIDFTPTTTTTNTTLAADSLPDIEVDFGDDPFLLELNNLHSVFDIVDEDNHVDLENSHENENDIVTRTTTRDGEERNQEYFEDIDRLLDSRVFEQIPPASQLVTNQKEQEQSNEEKLLLENPFVGDFPIDIDLETEELYKELASMSLTENVASTDGNNVTIAAPTTDKKATSNDKKMTAVDLLMGANSKNDKKITAVDLLMGPNHLMCKPCSPGDYNSMVNNNIVPVGDYSLPPITEDQPIDTRSREEIIRDLRALYMESASINPSDLPPLDHSDPLLAELEARYIESERLAQQLQYQQQQEESEKLWKNAKHWSKAFGVNLDDLYESSNGEQKKLPPKDTSKTGIGHKETIFGVSFSEDGKYVATASQDARIGIWEVATNRLLSSLKGHDTNYECLRVDWANRKWAENVLDRSTQFANLIASSGADGTVKLWACQDKERLDKEGRRGIDNKWKCEYTIDHADLIALGMGKAETSNAGKITNEKVEKSEDEVADKGKDEKPQVYSLQFIDHWDIFTKNMSEHCSRHSRQLEELKNDNEHEENSFLMTSSDEFIHLWELESHAFDKQLKLDDRKIRILQDKIKFKEVMSLHFGPLDQFSYGVTACSVTGTGMKLPPPPSRHGEETNENIAFGGERNPNNTIFIFDAAYSPSSGLLGVALADGSLRLVNGRGACISVIQLPGNQSHLTSFCWDKTGSRLATCVATGHLITWSLDNESHQGGNYNTVATCTAIFEGGHDSGRPLYGSRFCGGEDENLLMSWGVDGKICLWYSQSHGNIYDPVAILRDDGSYPVFAVEISHSEQNVVVGGGSDGGFIGNPVYFYEVPPLARRQT